VKFPKKKPSGGTETPDGVEPRRGVNSNHENVEYFIVVTKSSSLIQCLVTASFHVRFQLSDGVEVGVEGLTVVSRIAANSYKLDVGNSNVAREKHCVAVRRPAITVPYHLHKHSEIYEGSL